MVITYTKQETVVPMKQLGRTLAFGIAGGIAIAVGSLFFLMGSLRVLQTETGSTFTGTWRFAPYFFVGLAACIGIGIAASRISKGLK